MSLPFNCVISPSPSPNATAIFSYPLQSYTSDTGLGMMNDLYQITMAYSYWLRSKSEEEAVFEFFFRKAPFEGKFTIFAGLSDCISFLEKFSFTQTDIEYLQDTLPNNIETGFFHYLLELNTKCVTLFAQKEGTIVNPNVPLIVLHGPLAVLQLLETPILNCINFPTLIATNAARYRCVCPDKPLLEGGMRRAQGPNGALTATKYAYLGGFNSTSNIAAGKLLGIPVKGTLSHSYISCHGDLPSDLSSFAISQNFNLAISSKYYLQQIRLILNLEVNTVQSELHAFLTFSMAFPFAFFCLIDTYDVMHSGLPNYLAVACALSDAGYKPLGLRLDSGNIEKLVCDIRQNCALVAQQLCKNWIVSLHIFVSGDLNLNRVKQLEKSGARVNGYLVGTDLVTCHEQAALGAVCKVVGSGGNPCFKKSESPEKMNLPGDKMVYRLHLSSGAGIIDYISLKSEPAPPTKQQINCVKLSTLSPISVIPFQITQLLEEYYDEGRVTKVLPKLKESRELVKTNLQLIDVEMRDVYISTSLYNMLEKMLSSIPCLNHMNAAKLRSNEL